MSPRLLFIFLSVSLVLLVGGLSRLFPEVIWLYLLLGPLVLMGWVDIFQKKHAIRRNFPVIGHFRYLLEEIRPEIQQYFIESNDDGMPFSREKRSVVYQRAKGVIDTIPFGSQIDLDRVGYTWVNHSLAPQEVSKEKSRLLIGGANTSQPYLASRLSVSAMSFGALSKNAILALNHGAAIGQFAHNTGEGGISRYHLEHEGDLIYQVGTGYFGCRTPQGTFCPDRFQEKASLPQVKMIEVKLSQGAKPGHGGILPGGKVTPEVAEAREVPLGEDILSPPAHSAFSTPIELLEFLSRLRDLSGGKPVGFKLCLGKRRDFFAICKAMKETGLQPDFIVVDGAEGGTGAAPLEFANSVGTPGRWGTFFIHNTLVGLGLRKNLKLIASGKIITGFHMVESMALGADAFYSARAMMFALGCIQALRCHTNNCPTGVATQDPALVYGLDPASKALRVAHFHQATMKSFLEVVGAVGLNDPDEIMPAHIQRRVSAGEIKDYSQIYPFVQEGAFLEEIPQDLIIPWENSRADRF